MSTTVLGLPLWSWEIFGGAIFFFAVAGLLTSYENGMSQEQTLEERFLDEGAETWLRSEADAAFDNLSLTEKWLLRTLIAQGPLTGEDLVSTGQRAGYQDVREAIDRMDRTPSLFISIDRRSFIPRCRIKTLYRKYLKQKLIE